MSKKFSNQEVCDYLKSLGYNLDSEYFSLRSNISFSDYEGYKYFSTLDVFKTSVRGGFKPFRFYKHNPHTIENITLWLKIENKPISIYPENEYIEAREANLVFQCKKCFRDFSACWNSIKYGQACPDCGVIRGGMKRRTPIEKVQYIFDNCDVSPIDISQFQGYESYMDVVCDKCGHPWNSRFGNICSGNACPKCRSSKGEKEVSKALDKYNLSYIPQMKFDGCVYKDKLKFDFFIPSKNLVIEFQGAQHYHPVDFSHSGDDVQSQKDFEILKIKDKIKKSYCKKNNINLLAISYKKFNEIDLIISKI